MRTPFGVAAASALRFAAPITQARDIARTATANVSR